MVSPTDIIYAQRLRALRLEKDIKQIEAANLIGIKDQQTYSKLENGQLPFSDEIIKNICKSFYISPKAFTRGDQNKNLNKDENVKFNSSNPTENDKSIIQQLIKSKEEIIAAKENLIAILKGEITRLRKNYKR
jgi:transcriptional regulator with XRE-family HTH domain